MAVRVTAAHTAEVRAEAGREAGEGGVAAAAAALSSGSFLGLPAPFSEEGNGATEAWCGRGAGGAARIQASRMSANLHNSHRLPCGHAQPAGPGPFLQPLGVALAKHRSLPFRSSVLCHCGRGPGRAGARGRSPRAPPEGDWGPDWGRRHCPTGLHYRVEWRLQECA